MNTWGRRKMRMGFWWGNLKEILLGGPSCKYEDNFKNDLK
jgi:hypothetical protein